MAHFTLFPPGESGELGDDIRELFDDLARSLGSAPGAYPGQCRPLVDVFETDAAVELVVDTCGVPSQALRVLFRSGVVIVAGEKAPAPTVPQAAYHLVERDFGRFARAVRLTGAFDIPRARATLRMGELTVVLPKLIERRGRAHHVPVVTPDTPVA
ncbi:MAG TPA: Hsp20/alpha crystallin family protein [Vicinamibacterales bacterium]|nr:Hsp20/alpha crystallin family protein [Vicinamibacterales bacterium]